MYTLIRSQTIKNLLIQQAPALVMSFVIAEFFYKFHSFTRECLAFLATWLVIDFVLSKVYAFFGTKQKNETAS